MMIRLSDKAFAKVNLSLDIVGRREDGYHLLRSVMQTVSLFDDISVTVSEGDGIEIICSEPGVPTDEKNTCYKAAKLLIAAAGVNHTKVTIEIAKKIPSMAGLGGGSADAAAVLRILNRSFGNVLGADSLILLASKVGADVPFLINGGTALCEGIGEKLTALRPLSKQYLLLIKPDIGVSTPEAYRAFDEGYFSSAMATDRLVAAIESGEDISEYIANDLERAVNIPQIENLHRLILENGAKASLMTGSGSCVYGLFDSEADCRRAYEALHNDYCFAKVCETI